VTLLALGRQDDAYRQVCQRQTNAITISPEVWWLGNNIAWAFSLRPRAVTDYHTIEICESWAQQAVAIARKMVEEYRNRNSMRATDMLIVRRGALANYLNTLGLVYYRAGKFTEAMVAIQESEGIRSDISNWILLTALHEQAGSHDEAGRWRARIKTQIGQTYGMGMVDSGRYENLLLIEEMCPEALP
jgi:hypothetical protein